MVELPKEAAARGRRMTGQKGTAAKPPAVPKTPGPSRKKTLNLETYKLHAMGDYVNTIRAYGTVDSYSTQSVGCLSQWLLTIHAYCV
jgi:hypothetical protein